MDSKRLHDLLIDRARSRARPDEYCEKHHVLPKSLGGTDEAANVVWLTAREHYLVHWLLYRIHKNREMAFAWYRMTAQKRSTQRYTSHTFAYARHARTKAMSSLFLGRKLSEEHKAKMAAAKKGKTYQQMGRGESSLKGRGLSEDHKQKVAATSIGRRWSEEAKKKQSRSFLGEGNHRYGKPTSEETKQKLSAALSAHHQKLKALKETA